MAVAPPLRRSLVLGALLILIGAAASAQTPSPFPYWQDAAGIVLSPMAGPIPDWRVTVGGGAAVIPLYEVADHYRIVPSPAFDIRYRDIAFVSSGDGLGVNLLRGDTYRAGIAVGYDVGRNAHLSGRLNGLGNVGAAPEVRLFGELAILPFIASADLRRALGGHDGVIGDLGLYLPVVGQENLVVFVGPTITFANERYMNAYFGVDTAQAQGSSAHFPVYRANGGLKSAGFGVTTVYHFAENWFLNADLAFERLADSAGNSPIVQDRNQFGISIVAGYEF
jgi:outer membrane scaffolding protein for murein synthesis (MipA/OmpV family)